MQRIPVRQVGRLSSKRSETPCRIHSSHTSGRSVSPKSISSRWLSQHRDIRRVSSAAEAHNNSLLNTNQLEHLPDGIARQPDFFEEGITFIKDLDSMHILATNDWEKKIPSPTYHPKARPVHDIPEAISSFDNMCLTIISKGCATIHEGNGGDGPDVKAWHASAIGWAELLTHACDWNRPNTRKIVTAVPMLAVAAVAPVVAQGGVHYLERIDGLLANSCFGDRSGSLTDMAKYATSFRDVFVTSQDKLESDRSDNSISVPIVSPRERWHLHALDQLLQNNHRQAMGAYLRLLELFPGDLLGLSLALDTAYTLGDADLALRAATNVATYWTERDAGRFGGDTRQGQTIATSLLAVGLASSARTSTAERLAETSLAKDADSSGGIAVWALGHSFASEGRSQEMVSKLATSDGVRLHERSGYLAFNTRMSGYGAISMLDTQRSGAGRSAIRLYDGSFGHVLHYSGNDVEGQERGGEEVCMAELKVPTSVSEDVTGAVGSMFSGWFGGGDDKPASPQPDQAPVTKLQKRTAEAVLTWLPPSPILMTHATALLLRLTLSDAISSSDDRWADLKTAWRLTIYNSVSSLTQDEQTSIEFTPLTLLAASLLFEPPKLHVKPVSQQLELAMQGLHQMGKLMKFGELKLQAVSTNNDDSANEWRGVLNYLSRAIDSTRWETPSGMTSTAYLPPAHDSASNLSIGWDFDTRQFLEYALCHAATKTGDYESLCLAKAVCSEGVTLRSNCPEMWNRYAMIMEHIGDDVAAENARAASISHGGGEGSAAF